MAHIFTTFIILLMIDSWRILLINAPVFSLFTFWRRVLFTNSPRLGGRKKNVSWKKNLLLVVFPQTVIAGVGSKGVKPDNRNAGICFCIQVSHPPYCHDCPFSPARFYLVFFFLPYCSFVSKLWSYGLCFLNEEESHQHTAPLLVLLKNGRTGKKIVTE